MQVDRIKPTLKAPKSKLLKLEHEKVHSNCAFKFNLRRSTEGDQQEEDADPSPRYGGAG